MATIKLRWSSLLNMTELEFIPEAPKILSVSDELVQSLSWLTATTGYDRRFLRCDANGALLTGHAWSTLHVVENDELYPAANTPDVTAALAANCGVLCATSTQIVKLSFVRVSGGASEHFYVPPGEFLFYPYPTYTVTATVVPADAGTANYVGVTTFKQ